MWVQHCMFLPGLVCENVAGDPGRDGDGFPGDAATAAPTRFGHDAVWFDGSRYRFGVEEDFFIINCCE